MMIVYYSFVLYCHEFISMLYSSGSGPTSLRVTALNVSAVSCGNYDGAVNASLSTVLYCGCAESVSRK